VHSFATGLKAFARERRGISARALAREAHLSHETVAAAFRGDAVPTDLVLAAILRACAASADEAARWEQRRAAVATMTVGSEAVGPARDANVMDADLAEYAAVADQADPDDSGCFRDAVTLHEQRIRRTGTRDNLGWVELRYCPVHRAAWGRFHGFESLSAFAVRHDVEIVVAVHRLSDDAESTFRQTFAHDYHWSGLLLADGGEMWSEAHIYEDGALAGGASTRRTDLPADTQ
jgi:transcriptional regulator with XRE-family HTH domain